MLGEEPRTRLLAVERELRTRLEDAGASRFGRVESTGTPTAAPTATANEAPAARRPEPPGRADTVVLVDDHGDGVGRAARVARARAEAERIVAERLEVARRDAARAREARERAERERERAGAARAGGPLPRSERAQPSPRARTRRAETDRRAAKQRAAARAETERRVAERVDAARRAEAARAEAARAEAARAEAARAEAARAEAARRVLVPPEPAGVERESPTWIPGRRARRARSRRLVPRVTVVLVACVLAAGAVWVVASRSTGHPAAPAAHGILPAGAAGSIRPWRLVLDDNFDGRVLDTRRWSTCYWWSPGGCTNGTSGELEWYRPANVRVVDGALDLEARRETVVDSQGAVHAYTSGMVSGITGNRDLFTFRYGLVEARAWVPQGTGLWSAFWMLPASRRSLPEVDVFETVGEQPDRASAHVHWAGASGPRQLGQDIRAVGLARGWHTYALDWEPGSLTWYVDGVQRWTVTDRAAVPSAPMYLLADLAVGGTFTHPPTPATPFPSSLRIDYVRVWQNR